MTTDLKYINGLWVGRFAAMASPCEVLVDSDDALLANRVLQIVRDEAIRIEHKFSRYRHDNIIAKINQSQGEAVEVDAETARLLDYANQCFLLSDGQFDITSGVLRQVWRFDGSANVPDETAIKSVLKKVGWQKVVWQSPTIRLQAGMEIDLGGIGKEFAVDSAICLIQSITPVSCLVNFGGDVAVTSARAGNKAWQVGVENAEEQRTPLNQAPLNRISLNTISLYQGAVATSGDARRYLLKNGKRFSHILNPTTGWSVEDAPRSVTVIAANCTEAGMLATFAMLQGAQAEAFLETQQVQYAIQR